MAKSVQQIERRKQLNDKLVEQAIYLANAKREVQEARNAIFRTKQELAQLNEIEGRDA